MIPEDVLAALRSIVGAGGLKTGDALGAIHPGADARNLDAGVMVSPANTAEVAAVLDLCNRRRIGVVPQGGRTGLAGGGSSLAGEIILSLAAMNTIQLLSASAGIAIVESGVTLQTLQEAAAGIGLSTGIDIAARGSASIGGMISTNAGGMEAFRHGTMRQRVLGLEVVFPDGAIMNELKQVTKSNEGYDLKQLLIGAEGTLGVVTRAVIKLAPGDGFTATALVACASASSAVDLFQHMRQTSGMDLLRAEFMDRSYFDVASRNLGPPALAAFTRAPAYLILENGAGEQSAAQSAMENALAQAIEQGLVIDAVLAQSEKERSAIWAIREDSGVIDRVYPNGHWFDISVPLQHLETWLVQFDTGIAALGNGTRGFAFGHLGDGNLHIGVAAATDKQAAKEIVYANLLGWGGSFSAEHGIGTEKMPELLAFADPVKLALMHSIKALVDPNGIMNPGKVLAGPAI
ncbi:MAG: FAD-binding oxidoreductase [Phyllobacterium sp.]